MKTSRRLNFFIRLAIVTFIVFCTVTIVKLQFEYNELQEKEVTIRSDMESIRDTIERLQSDLSAPFDDRYIIRIAREKLNYYLPEEIIFYSDR